MLIIARELPARARVALQCITGNRCRTWDCHGCNSEQGRSLRMLLAGLPRRFKLIARLPSSLTIHIGGLPSQGKTEACNQCVASKVHVVTISIAGLVVAFSRILFFLLQPPGRVVTLEFVALF